MGYTEFILVVNLTSTAILLIMALLLSVVTRFKGEGGYAVLIISLTTVPVYVYNVCCCLECYSAAYIFSSLAHSVGFVLMPLLWLLVQRGFNPYYSLSFSGMLHFVPAILLFILFSLKIYSLPVGMGYESGEYENCGADTWMSGTYYIVLLVQLFCYSFFIFRWLRKVKRYICDHYSNIELEYKAWIPRFATLFVVMFIIVMVCHIIWPCTDAWLVQVLNVLVMMYLFYTQLENSFYGRNDTQNVMVKAETGFSSVEDVVCGNDDSGQLRLLAGRIEEYLKTSEAYVNPDLSLNEVAKANGVSAKVLSKAINTVLGRNFFELINSYRIEKSKGLLLVKRERRLTIETIAEKCGFNSRSVFSVAFKKVTGLTTSEWLRKVQEK